VRERERKRAREGGWEGNLFSLILFQFFLKTNRKDHPAVKQDCNHKSFPKIQKKRFFLFENTFRIDRVRKCVLADCRIVCSLFCRLDCRTSFFSIFWNSFLHFLEQLFVLVFAAENRLNVVLFVIFCLEHQNIFFCCLFVLAMGENYNVFLAMMFVFRKPYCLFTSIFYTVA